MPPRRRTAGTTALKPFHLPDVSFCDNPWPCSLEPEQAVLLADQPRPERHPGLLLRQQLARPPQAAPIGFTEAAGNFQLKNNTASGTAATPSTRRPTTAPTPTPALPDGGHIDNANMSTPPDGQAPRDADVPAAPARARRTPTATRSPRPTSATRPTPSTTSTPTACPTGWSSTRPATRRSAASRPARWARRGATGTPWTTWSSKGLQATSAGMADIQIFQYDGEGVFLDRTEPIDCKVGSTAELCTGGATGHARRLHLRRLRQRSAAAPRCTPTARSGRRPCGTCATSSGSHKTEALVTRAMELAPYNPSFLDMRNAILVADTARLRRRTTTTRSGRCSPTAAWASSRAASAATTPTRARTSTPRRPTTTRATITGTVTDAGHRRAGRRGHGHPGLPGRRRAPRTRPTTTDADGTLLDRPGPRRAPTPS